MSAWTGRVEEWRGGLGTAYRSGPFVCRGFTSRTLPRFHSPLIEPDMQISRIRLSDQVHTFAHEKRSFRVWSFSNPRRWYRCTSEKRDRLVPCTFIFRPNH